MGKMHLHPLNFEGGFREREEKKKEVYLAHTQSLSSKSAKLKVHGV